MTDRDGIWERVAYTTRVVRMTVTEVLTLGPDGDGQEGGSAKR